MSLIRLLSLFKLLNSKGPGALWRLFPRNLSSSCPAQFGCKSTGDAWSKGFRGRSLCSSSQTCVDVYCSRSVRLSKGNSLFSHNQLAGCGADTDQFLFSVRQSHPPVLVLCLPHFCFPHSSHLECTWGSFLEERPFASKFWLLSRSGHWEPRALRVSPRPPPKAPARSQATARAVDFEALAVDCGSWVPGQTIALGLEPIFFYGNNNRFGLSNQPWLSIHSMAGFFVWFRLDPSAV